MNSSREDKRQKSQDKLKGESKLTVPSADRPALQRINSAG